jgi:hypothetical protein
VVPDIQLEQLYQQAYLVRGAGNRTLGEFCIMSLIALLSGEEHTDQPSGVSDVIRRFAITINDRMPDHLRQRLKPFAPRLMGTKDGRDDQRIALVLAAVHQEILPRAAADQLCGQPSLNRQPGKSRLLAAISNFRHPNVWLARLTGGPVWSADPPDPDNIANATAQLLAHCAEIVGKNRGEWYWLKAVDLLDRIADVTNEQQSGSSTILHNALLSEG